MVHKKYSSSKVRNSLSLSRGCNSQERECQHLCLHKTKHFKWNEPLISLRSQLRQKWWECNWFLPRKRIREKRSLVWKWWKECSQILQSILKIFHKKWIYIKYKFCFVFNHKCYLLKQFLNAIIANLQFCLAINHRLMPLFKVIIHTNSFFYFLFKTF